MAYGVLRVRYSGHRSGNLGAIGNSRADAGQLDNLVQGPGTRIPFRQTLRYMLKNRAVVHLLAGAAIATLWSWGLMWWRPTYLQRAHSLTVGEAGGLLAPMHLFAGTGGSLLAWWLMSRPGAGSARHASRLLAVVTIVGTVPSILMCATTSLSTATLMLWIYVPTVYFYIGPAFGLLQNVVPPEMRATACAIMLFCSNVANLIIAPQVIGWLSDGLFEFSGSRAISLRWSLLMLAPTGFWAAWHFWRFGKTIDVMPSVAGSFAAESET